MVNTTRIALRVWKLLCLIVVLLFLFPISTGIIRTFQLIILPSVWLGAIVLTYKRTWPAVIIAACGLGILCLFLLPGRSVNSDQLQNLYVRHLQRYKGTIYIWGGENKLGIDCSGLVRRAMINANLQIGLTTLNPTATRQAFTIWWYDCSAKALGTHYKSFTESVMEASSINDLPTTSLHPGDLAITPNGEHVLAYLGAGEWIQTDPYLMRVAMQTVPSKNKWFRVPVHIVRWSQLAQISE